MQLNHYLWLSYSYVTFHQCYYQCKLVQYLGWF
jgi:hypothetical protein